MFFMSDSANHHMQYLRTQTDVEITNAAFALLRCCTFALAARTRPIMLNTNPSKANRKDKISPTIATTNAVVAFF